MKNANLLELLLMVVAVLWPMFFFASSIDGDEFLKSGAGVASGGMALGAYKLWQGRHRDSDDS